MVLDDDDLRYQSIGLFIADITEAIYSERAVCVLTTNSELLALQVTENASKTGEHYVSTDKQGFRPCTNRQPVPESSLPLWPR